MASQPAHGSGVPARSAFPCPGRSGRPGWTLIALCAFVPARSWSQEAPGLEAGAPVNGLGAVAALEIAGASSFREGAIVQAVRWSPRYLLASHPRSNLSEYLAFLEEGIRSGYLLAGFRDAEVKASVDGGRGRVVVQVKEGRRWKAGAVHVEGSRALAESAIVERLTRSRTTRKEDGEEETKGPLWEEGSPAPFDSQFLGAAKRHVEALYAEAGHLSARVDVAVKAGDEAAADLLVKVLEEGDAYTLGDVRFLGSFSDPEKDIRRLGGITESLRLDQGSLESVKARLESTGRYLKVKVEPPTLRDGGKADLQITLYQADFAPPLDEPASEERRVLSRAAAWLGKPDRWGVDLSLRVESGQGLQSGHDFAGALEILLGKDGLAAILRVGSGSSPFRGTFGLCLQRGEGLLVATPLRIRARFTTAGSVRFIGSVNAAPADPENPARDPRPMSLHLGFGVVHWPGKDTERPPFQLRVTLAETALTYMERSGDFQLLFDGEVLQVTRAPRGQESVQLGRIDRRSGEVSVSFRKDLGKALLVLESGPGKLAHSFSSLLRESDEARCVVVSPARWLVDAQVLTAAMLLQRWGGPPSPGRKALELIAARIPQVSSSLVDYLEAELLAPSDDSDEQRFMLALPEPPGMDPSSSALAQMMGGAASWLTPLFPRGSWPEALVREAACAIGMSSKYLGEELRRFSESSRLGPIGALVFAEALHLARLRAPSQSFARAGLGQLSLEGLGREKDWALAPGCLPRKILETIGQAASLAPAADMDAIVSEAERPGTETDRALAGRLQAARSSSDPAIRGWLLVEAFWSAGLAGAVKDRLAALAEGE